MRIVIGEFISLDGVVQAPGGPSEDTDGGFAHGGWSMSYFDDAMGGHIDAAMARTEALLFGRRTWQVMAGAWPDRAGDPFADRMNEITKYVVTDTLGPDDLVWTNTTRVAGGDLLATVRELRARDGGDVQVMGSATVARALIEADLVDELNLMVHPVLLGGGKRLFPDHGTARRFELTSVVTAGTGVNVCTYRPAGADG